MNDFNAADTRKIREAKRAAKAVEAERGTVVFNLMGSPAGRSYVYDFLGRCLVFHTPFTGSAPTTDFNCGRQSVGLELIAEVVRFAPDAYITMLREAADREIANDRSSDNRSNGRSPERGRDDSGAGGSVDADYEPGDDLDADRVD